MGIFYFGPVNGSAGEKWPAVPTLQKKKQTKVCPSWDPAGPSTH